jgi:Flp pilus assembly protein TadD
MLHPLKVEAVAWASGQVYLLAAFWTVLAVWIYVRSIDDSGSSRVPGRMLAAAFYLCSILSKAVGFGLPLVLLMLDYYPLRRHKKRPPRELWLEKLPFFGISALGVGISIWARGHEHDLHSLAQLGIWDRAARVGTSLSIYARHLLEFSSLSPFYPELPLPAPLTATAVMGLVGGSILLLGAFLLRRSIPSLLVSWVACLLFLAPHLGFVPTGRVAAADRYTYLASLALAPVIAQGVIAVMAAGLRRRAAVVAIGGLVTAVLASATFRQVGHWRNSVTLWQRALAVAEEKTAELYFNVARSLQIAGRTGEAVEMLKESLRVDPEYKNSLLNLSAIHLAERRHAEAVSPLEQLLRLYPQEAAAHSNLGLALAGVGRLRDAESHFLEAVELDPGRPDFAANLARFYLHVGQAEAGLSALLRFKASGKREMAVDLLTAKALIRSGRVERARAELDESVAFWDGRGTPTIGLRCLRSAAQTGALEDIDQCR